MYQCCSILSRFQTSKHSLQRKVCSSKKKIEITEESTSAHGYVNTESSLRRVFLPSPRTEWVRPIRSSEWWEQIVLSAYDHHDWIENFRVTQAMFKYLCDQLRLLISKQDTRMRPSITTERRVAITLWVLTTTGEYRSVAHLFGVARCLLC